ncbi:MAG: GIY-YIG nuclease family protein [Patescibacteria group bacterium]
MPKGNNHSNLLKSQLKTIPLKPGVYFWLDKKGRVLYVGRATKLRQRLSQYFSNRVEARIQEMVAQAVKIRYEVTENVLEAIILEAKNIKKYWPKYNVVDRDDRSFIYIVIPKDDYPRPLIVRGRDLRKFSLTSAKVFGPYQSFHLVQSALRLIRRVFPYSTCRPLSGRACFDYQIGLCPGACLGTISSPAYRKNIRNLELFLAGDKKTLVKRLMKDNPDKLRALQHIQDVSLLGREENLEEAKLSRIEGYDISHHAGRETYASLVVFENGQANPNEYRLFKIKKAAAGDDERALLEALERRFNHPGWPSPDMIMIDGGSPQISFLSRHLAKYNLKAPLVGISKFGGDRLVFATGTKQSVKELATNLKPTLLKLREEAHRFANYGRTRRKLR